MRIRWTWWWKGLLAAGLCLVLLGVIAWAYLPRLVHDQAVSLLSTLGVNEPVPVSLAVEQVGWRGLTLGDVVVGQHGTGPAGGTGTQPAVAWPDTQPAVTSPHPLAATVQRVQVDYSLASLMGMRVSEISVSGLVVPVRIQGGQVRAGPWFDSAVPRPALPTTTPTDLGFSRVHIRDSRMSLWWDGQVQNLPMAGTIDQAGGRLTLKLSANYLGAPLAVTGWVVPALGTYEINVTAPRRPLSPLFTSLPPAVRAMLPGQGTGEAQLTITVRDQHGAIERGARLELYDLAWQLPSGTAGPMAVAVQDVSGHLNVGLDEAWQLATVDARMLAGRVQIGPESAQQVAVNVENAAAALGNPGNPGEPGEPGLNFAVTAHGPDWQLTRLSGTLHGLLHTDTLHSLSASAQLRGRGQVMPRLASWLAGQGVAITQASGVELDAQLRAALRDASWQVVVPDFHASIHDINLTLPSGQGSLADAGIDLRGTASLTPDAVNVQFSEACRLTVGGVVPGSQAVLLRRPAPTNEPWLTAQGMAGGMTATYRLGSSPQAAIQPGHERVPSHDDSVQSEAEAPAWSLTFPRLRVTTLPISVAWSASGLAGEQVASTTEWAGRVTPTGVEIQPLATSRIEAGALTWEGKPWHASVEKFVWNLTGQAAGSMDSSTTQPASQPMVPGNPGADAPPAAPWRYTFATGSWSAAPATSLDTGSVHLQGPDALRVSLPGIRLSAKGELSSEQGIRATSELAWDKGRAELPAWQLVLPDIAARIPLVWDGSKATLSKAATPTLQPTSAPATGTADLLDGITLGQFTITTPQVRGISLPTLTGGLGVVNRTAMLAMDWPVVGDSPLSGSGTVAWMEDGVRARVAATQPTFKLQDAGRLRALLPALSDYLITGQAEASATATYAGSMTPRLRLTLRDSGITSQDKTLVVQGIAGTVMIDSLAPLASPPEQKLQVAKIQSGAVELTEATVTYRVQGLDKIHLDKAQASLGGGRVWVESLDLNPMDLRLETTIHVEKVELGWLLEKFASAYAQGNGPMTGSITLSYDGKQIKMLGGELRNDKPGFFAVKDTKVINAAAANVAQQMKQQGAPDARVAQVRDQVIDAVQDMQFDTLVLGFAPDKMSLQVSGKARKPTNPVPIGNLQVNVLGLDELLALALGWQDWLTGREP